MSRSDSGKAPDAVPHPSLYVGRPVLFWPGEKRGTGRCGTVISEPAPFGGRACVRIRKVLGGTDYIAVTHVEPIGRTP
jgi:hypothetical protein